MIFQREWVLISGGGLGINNSSLGRSTPHLIDKPVFVTRMPTADAGQENEMDLEEENDKSIYTGIEIFVKVVNILLRKGGSII